VPHEPGNEFEFRMLSAKQLDEASERQTDRALAMVGKLSGTGIEIPTDAETIERTRRDGAANPAGGYDADLLVRYGLVNWRGEKYEGAPCDGPNKDELDTATRDWAADIALKISIISTEAKASGEAQSSEAGSAVNGTGSRRSASARSGAPS